jgi:peptidoglycan/LPS O-acetylase OafA/YrhL
MRHSDTNSRYATLDGLRGATALLVVIVHFPSFFHLRSIEHGYLAVDLFFAMSGFVIGNAYDRKLASGALSWRQYVVLRLIRLYPLYCAGVALGVVALMLRLPASDWTLLASALPASVLMLPSHVALPTFYPEPTVYHFFYPLDFPAWSLFSELVASICYGLFFRYLTTRTLVAIMCASGLVLMIAAFTCGINCGVYWKTFYVGFARLGYAFPAGLLLYRFRRPSRTHGNLAAIAVVLLAIGMLSMPWPTSGQSAFDLLLSLVVLPATVWAATRAEPSQRLLPLFAFSGAVSYGIYVLHVPFQFIVGDLVLRTNLLHHPARVTAAVLLPGIVLLAWCAERYYDAPVRRALLSRTRSRLAVHPVSAATGDASPHDPYTDNWRDLAVTIAKHRCSRAPTPVPSQDRRGPEQHD